VWYLGQEPCLGNTPKNVVFISNTRRRCIFFNQRASHSAHLPIVWDYHVILLCYYDGWKVWDLDSLLDMPSPLGHYINMTFAQRRMGEIDPCFRVIAYDEFRDTFSSDRSHMRDPSGNWLAPPPTWPIIMMKQSPNVEAFIDMSHASFGRVLTLREFVKEYGA
jgi:protein N-terminal glutamine amidohydrolase